MNLRRSIKTRSFSFLRVLSIVVLVGLAFMLANPSLIEAQEKDAETRTLVEAMGNEFLVEWLQGHDEEHIVSDENGIGMDGNPSRIKILLYEIKESDGGFIVENEFRIKMPDGREIIEFLAGMGETSEAAINDTLSNFTLTTFHPAYKAFMNADDPHQEITDLEINGKKRKIVIGDIVTRSNEENPLEGFDLSKMVSEQIAALELDDKTHWLKVVYGQAAGTPITVSVTLDNEGHQKLTDRVSEFHWPTVEGFYMTKQFIIIMPLEDE